MAIKHFRRGSSTFPCNVCGRTTRDTQSVGTNLCGQCFDLAGIENEISDGHCTLAERLAEIRGLITDVKAKGGDVQQWVDTFGQNAIKEEGPMRGRRR